MIGYGFMGRAHSNAYEQVGQFFPSQHKVVLIIMAFAHLILFFIATVDLPSGGKKGIPPPSQEEICDVREMLGGYDDNQERALILLSERVFPIYQSILTLKDVKGKEIARIFGTLSQVKADRSQFLDHAVSGLAHENDRVRSAALHLLAQIGSSRDCAPIVAILSDREWTNSIAAAKTLAAIGDQRSLIAIDVWLNSSSPRRHEGEKLTEMVRKNVIKYRDELKARLEKEKAKPLGK